jgi:hypothetical protein
MKRFLVLAFLSLGTAALCDRPVLGWCNFGLNTGIGFCWRAGNNSYLWGLLRSGQAPPGYPNTGPTSYWENLPPQGCFPSAAAYFPPSGPVPQAQAAPRLSRPPMLEDQIGPRFQPSGHFSVAGPGGWSPSPNIWYRQ